MKKISISAVTILVFSLISTPTSYADQISYPCGDGATYQVYMPAGVATDGKKCSGVLIIDTSVKIIDDSAFYGSLITSVVIPNSVTKIGKSAFWNAPLSSISLPESLESIDSGAFFNNYDLTSIRFPSSLKSIGNAAFQHTPLTTVSLPNSLTSLGSYVFSDTKITSAQISKSLREIPSGTFEATPLQEIDIPESVTEIGAGAFAATGLITVRIPASVKTIGDKAFSGASSLKLVEFVGIPTSLGSGIFERAFSINQISFCGIATDFPIKPTCTPEQQRVIDSKLSENNDWKTECEASKSISALKADLIKLVQIKGKPTKLWTKRDTTNFQKAFEVITLNCNDLTETFWKKNGSEIKSQTINSIKVLNALYDRYLNSIPITISCYKSGTVKKVSGTKPTCPKGYKLITK